MQECPKALWLAARRRRGRAAQPSSLLPGGKWPLQSHAHGTAFSLVHNMACAVPMGRVMRRVTNTTQLRAPRSVAPLTWPHGPLEWGAPQRCHRGMGRGRVFMLISTKTRFLNQASLLSFQLHLLSLQDVPAAPVSQTNISLENCFPCYSLGWFSAWEL